ncbi:hypothetical protein FB45DRAFT_935153 [Roridomyces roridus]|uniref:Uncharacterized protein n=1 Tax=Roridomyces roridus TaxID=1738132 RepID=A0AAD7BB34_9AGAR|nr:hypothetical protein FB45DRAFT_935153 [Roridomyces roridus]
MCQRIAQGTRWARCGHFQRHFIRGIVDCASYRCSNSVKHPDSCIRPNCHCIRDWSAEIQEDIDTADDYCWACRSARERAAGRS